MPRDGSQQASLSCRSWCTGYLNELIRGCCLVLRAMRRWVFSELSGLRRAWPGIKTCQQYSKNAGQEYAVKSSRAADRSDRSAEAAHLVEIGEVSADQRAEAASDIGKRCR